MKRTYVNRHNVSSISDIYLRPCKLPMLPIEGDVRVIPEWWTPSKLRMWLRDVGTFAAELVATYRCNFGYLERLDTREPLREGGYRSALPGGMLIQRTIDSRPEGLNRYGRMPVSFLGIMPGDGVNALYINPTFPPRVVLPPIESAQPLAPLTFDKDGVFNATPVEGTAEINICTVDNDSAVKLLIYDGGYHRMVYVSNSRRDREVTPASDHLFNV